MIIEDLVTAMKRRHFFCSLHSRLQNCRQQQPKPSAKPGAVFMSKSWGKRLFYIGRRNIRANIHGRSKDSSETIGVVFGHFWFHTCEEEENQYTFIVWISTMMKMLTMTKTINDDDDVDHDDDDSSSNRRRRKRKNDDNDDDDDDDDNNNHINVNSNKGEEDIDIVIDDSNSNKNDNGSCPDDDDDDNDDDDHHHHHHHHGGGGGGGGGGEEEEEDDDDDDKDDNNVEGSSSSSNSSSGGGGGGGGSSSDGGSHRKTTLRMILAWQRVPANLWCKPKGECDCGHCAGLGCGGGLSRRTGRFYIVSVTVQVWAVARAVM